MFYASFIFVTILYITRLRINYQSIVCVSISKILFILIMKLTYLVLEPKINFYHFLIYFFTKKRLTILYKKWRNGSNIFICLLICFVITFKTNNLNKFYFKRKTKICAFIYFDAARVDFILVISLLFHLFRK